MRLLLSLPLSDLTFYARTYSTVLPYLLHVYLFHQILNTLNFPSLHFISFHFTVFCFVSFFLFCCLEFLYIGNDLIDQCSYFESILLYVYCTFVDLYVRQRQEMVIVEKEVCLNTNYLYLLVIRILKA
jgi:hypothetical protein